jgi:LysM repeat protein
VGETLAQVATLYGTTTQALVDANGLSNPNLIRIGQQLAIPGSTPAPATTPVTAPPTATHTVAPGETLDGIALKYGTTAEAIAAANGIIDPSVIYIGTTLRLSGEAFVATPPPTPSPMIHTVAPGEILANVASLYGTTVTELVTTNGIANPNLITIGQQLQVPATTPGWICPVAGARYFNDWGFPRSGGRFHEGNDLFAPRGTAVVAPISGTVIFQNGRIGGLQFRLYAEDGTTYIGSHLDTVGVDGFVAAGVQLGTVGDSGNAVGGKTHLHFEMHPGDGAAVNPYPTLKKFGC